MGLCKRQPKITISVTTKCNLDCVYCYTNKTAQPNATIPIQFAKAGILDFIEEHDGGRLRFFGAGEPTCEFSIIKELLTFARTVATKPVYAEIQTNGAFSPSAADYLARNFSLVYLSWDGPPAIQNHYRPTAARRDTSSLVERNLRHLQQSTTLQIAARSKDSNLVLPAKLSLTRRKW
jgi:sulfatase maturation enzyme AslB (radical SAM superfamily)